MNLSELTRALDSLIPFSYAEPWDHVGLQVGDPNHPVRSAVLSLDLTAAAISYATAVGADLIICHHPPIFEPLTGLRLDHPHEALFHRLIKSDLAVIALHTNLDAVPGGVADQLAALLELSGIETVSPLPDGQSTETIDPDSPWILEFPVKPGYGRTGKLHEPLSLSKLAGRLRSRLTTPHLLISAKGDHPVSCVSVCPGSFDGDWISCLKDQGSELLICGEIKYHHQLELLAVGIDVIVTGHDVSERVVLSPLADMLAARYPEVAFAVCPPFDYNEVAF